MRLNGSMPSCQGTEGPVESLSSGCGDCEEARVPEQAGQAQALFSFPLCLWKPEGETRDAASSLGKDFPFILCWWDRDKVSTWFYQKCSFLELNYQPCEGSDWSWCLLVSNSSIFPVLAQPSWNSICSWEGRKALSTAANHCSSLCKVSAEDNVSKTTTATSEECGKPGSSWKLHKLVGRVESILKAGPASEFRASLTPTGWLFCE